MPKVGSRNFGYTKAGIASAKKFAKLTGQRLEMGSKPTSGRRKKPTPRRSNNPKQRKY